MSRRENKELAKTNLKNMDKTMQKLQHIGSKKDRLRSFAVPHENRLLAPFNPCKNEKFYFYFIFFKSLSHKDQWTGFLIGF